MPSCTSETVKNGASKSSHGLNSQGNLELIKCVPWMQHMLL